MKMRSALNVPYFITKGVLAIICSNSFSHCQGNQKKTVAISQMFNHVHLHVHWIHCMQVYLCNTYSVLCSVRCISYKIWIQISPFLICSTWSCAKELDKIIARMPCFMHQNNFRPNYIFNNDAYFFRFLRTKIPFDHF